MSDLVDLVWIGSIGLAAVLLAAALLVATINGGPCG